MPLAGGAALGGVDPGALLGGGTAPGGVDPGVLVAGGGVGAPGCGLDTDALGVCASDVDAIKPSDSIATIERSASGRMGPVTTVSFAALSGKCSKVGRVCLAMRHCPRN